MICQLLTKDEFWEICDLGLGTKQSTVIWRIPDRKAPKGYVLRKKIIKTRNIVRIRELTGLDPVAQKPESEV